MPNWSQIQSEISRTKNGFEAVRNKYLSSLSSKLGAPVIAYYSGFLQRKGPDGRFHSDCGINDLDMNGFMSAVHSIRDKSSVYLILHTPGGDVNATDSIVKYLKTIFSNNLHCIVPHMAMSAGTMIACACRQIYMAKHSCLGPTDPHIAGMAAMGVIAEIEKAMDQIKKDQHKIVFWNNVFQKYNPTMISECDRAISGSRVLLMQWLKEGMFEGQADAEALAIRVSDKLLDYHNTAGHSAHFMRDECKASGLVISDVEANQSLQEDILSCHHAFSASFLKSNSNKIIESSCGSIWSVGAGP